MKLGAVGNKFDFAIREAGGGGRRPVLVRFLSRSAKLQVVRNARQLRVLAYLLPRVVSP